MIPLLSVPLPPNYKYHSYTYMIKVGEYNKLRAVRQTDNGIYFVDKEESGEVLLPNKFIPDELYEDDILELFVFRDHQGRLTATTQKPLITVNKFAYLKVNDVHERHGAFVEWGLDKDLLVPFRNQPTERLEAGKSYIIYLYEDNVSGRLVGSANYTHFAKNRNVKLSVGEEVDLLIDKENELGFNVIINHRNRGLIFHRENFKKIKVGDTCKGYIKLIRKDGNIDVSLHGTTLDKVSSSAQKILNMLEEKGGFLPYHDKTDAAIVRRELGMSKKTFKQAIGGLYGRRRILIEKGGIYLPKHQEQRLEEEE